MGSDDGNLYAINGDSGTLIWQFATGDSVRSSPALDSNGTFVFVGSSDNYVYCLNAATGEMIWNFATGAEVVSSPSISDGMVYLNFYYYMPSLIYPTF